MIDEIKLDAIEARVLGVLIEKALTTPEQYPLSLNGATLGCNQKSNRDPVLELMEGEVNTAIGKLIVKGLAGSVHPSGGRVEKFRHNAEAVLKVTTPQAALLAELLMRGPQQPGELRARVSRMAQLDTQQALTDLLRPLTERGLVVRLDPTPGSRAERYAQTLSPTSHVIETKAAAPVRAFSSSAAATAAAIASEDRVAAPAFDPAPMQKRVDDLEHEVRVLRRQLDALAWKLGHKFD
ncbi:MAG: DUF480 domain-containing protein [Planctomycetota bacterium]|nr:DUF480 domain-containing protein [Planctomycetota bacterium]